MLEGLTGGLCTDQHSWPTSRRKLLRQIWQYRETCGHWRP
jgi:hypothetical protein